MQFVFSRSDAQHKFSFRARTVVCKPHLHAKKTKAAMKSRPKVAGALSIDNEKDLGPSLPVRVTCSPTCPLASFRLQQQLNESLRIGLLSSRWDEANMDHVDTDRLTACPSCGAPMRFLRTVPPFGGLPELQTFACRPCGLAVSAEQVLQLPELLLAVRA